MDQARKTSSSWRTDAILVFCFLGWCLLLYFDFGRSYDDIIEANYPATIKTTVRFEGTKGRGIEPSIDGSSFSIEKEALVDDARSFHMQNDQTLENHGVEGTTKDESIQTYIQLKPDLLGQQRDSVATSKIRMKTDVVEKGGMPFKERDAWFHNVKEVSSTKARLTIPRTQMHQTATKPSVHPPAPTNARENGLFSGLGSVPSWLLALLPIAHFTIVSNPLFSSFLAWKSPRIRGELAGARHSILLAHLGCCAAEVVVQMEEFLAAETGDLHFSCFCAGKWKWNALL